MKLTEIIFLNDVIQRHRSQGAKVQLIMVIAYYLHVHVKKNNVTVCGCVCVVAELVVGGV